MEKAGKNKKPTTPSAAPAAPAKATQAKTSPTPPPAPAQVPPLFRRVDWVAAVIAFAVIWVVYFITLAPELTLEDSG